MLRDLITISGIFRKSKDIDIMPLPPPFPQFGSVEEKPEKIELHERNRSKEREKWHQERHKQKENDRKKREQEKQREKALKWELKEKNKKLRESRIKAGRKKLFNFFNSVGLLRTEEQKREIERHKQEYKKRKELAKKLMEEEDKKRKIDRQKSRNEKEKRIMEEKRQQLLTAKKKRIDELQERLERKKQEEELNKLGNETKMFIKNEIKKPLLKRVFWDREKQDFEKELKRLEKTKPKPVKEIKRQKREYQKIKRMAKAYIENEKMREGIENKKLKEEEKLKRKRELAVKRAEETERKKIELENKKRERIKQQQLKKQEEKRKRIKAQEIKRKKDEERRLEEEKLKRLLEKKRVEAEIKERLEEQKKKEKQKEKMKLMADKKKINENVKLPETRLLKDHEMPLRDVKVDFPPKKKSFFSRLFGRKDKKMKEPPKLPELQNLEMTKPKEIREAEKEIKKAIEGIKSPSLFSRLFKKKKRVQERIERPEVMPRFEEKMDAVEAIEQKIHKSRLALMDFKLDKAKLIYEQIMRLYNDLDKKDKEKVYRDISDLYYERKSAERLVK